MATNLLNRLAPIFISHGSPNLYMDTLSESFAFYRNLGKSYLERTPRIEAVVIFSAHWDTSDSIHVTTSAKHNQVRFSFLLLSFFLFFFLVAYYIFF